MRFSKNNRAVFMSLLLIVAVAIGSTYAFMTASDVKTNKFLIGNIDILLHEDDWYDPYGNVINDSNDNDVPDQAENITAGDEIDKAPYVANTGENPAFIYMSVGIPVATTEEAYSTSSTQATAQGEIKQIIVTAYGIQDGYKGCNDPLAMWNEYADYETLFGTEAEDLSDRIELFRTVDAGDPNNSFDETNWILLDAQPYYSSTGYNYYVYGYTNGQNEIRGSVSVGVMNASSALDVNDETSSLFDTVVFLEDFGEIQ